MTPFNLEWWFHWTHDEAFVEVLKVSIPALGSILAALIAWYGIRRTAKVTQEALENSKEATPPELLRLEKWSNILKDSNDYPENIKNGLDIETIQSTYDDILKRATLENRIQNLGILSEEVRQKLLQIRPGSGSKYYPDPTWKISKENYKYLLMLMIMVIILSCYIYLLCNIVFVSDSLNIFDDGSRYSLLFLRIATPIVAIILLVVTVCMAFIVYIQIKVVCDIFLTKKDDEYYAKSVCFMNGYKILKDIYLAPYISGLIENEKQIKIRDKFEKSRLYKEWKKNNDEHPDWGSWNYGLNIGWDNSPNLENQESEEPTESASVGVENESESTLGSSQKITED